MVASALAVGVLAAPLALRGLGVARVVLRYAERLVTHAATFRALADLRVWFFRNLARSSAGGLGFRQAGDVLARLVGDIEALDGLYLRILVPLAGAVLLLPVLVVLIGVHSPLLAGAIGVLFAIAAFALPWVGARMAARAGLVLADTTGALRIAALDALTGLREVRAFGAEGRMLASVQAREAAMLSTQHELAGRTALANAGAFLCGQMAILAVLIAAGIDPVAAVAGGVSGGGGVRGGGRPAACRGARRPCRRCRASRAGGRRSAGAGAGSATGRPAACRLRAPLRRRAFPLAAGPAAGVRRPDARRAAGRPRRAAGAVRRRQVHARGAGAEGSGAAGGPDPAGRRRYRHARRRRCACADRLARAGDPPVRRHDPRQPPAGPAGRRRCGAVGRARCRAGSARWCARCRTVSTPGWAKAVRASPVVRVGGWRWRARCCRRRRF